MIVPVLIDGKEYNAKSIDSLTTKEFIDVTAIENLDIVKYIAWATGVKNESAFFAVTSATVDEAIGVFPVLENMSFPDSFDKKKCIRTIGQRHQIESSKLEGFELMVFCLAVAQVCSNNIDDINDAIIKYMSMPYIEVIPAGFFFLKNLETGRSFVTKNSSWLRRLINTRNLKSKQGLKG